MSLRAGFPEDSFTTTMIYVDHNATVPTLDEAISATAEAMATLHGNPSSVHQVGQAARNAIDGARRDVAALVGASSREIVFTSGATEANQIILRSNLALADDAERRRRVLITSAAEHPSVRRVAESLSGTSVDVRWLPLDHNGRIDAGDLERALDDVRNDPDSIVLVSLMRAQNELGNLYDVRGLARIARAAGAVVHTDATQAVGRIPVDVDELGVDFMTFSSHKLGGPKGVGALYARRGHVIESIFDGGHQERGRRPGTENVPGIVGFGAACRVAAEKLVARWDAVRELGALLRRELSSIPDATVLGDEASNLGNTVCVSFSGVEADALLIGLDLAGVAISAGSACASGSLEPSPVLAAMQVDDAVARGAVRFSVGWTNTRSELEEVVSIVADEVAHQRGVTAVTDVATSIGRRA